MTMPMDRWLRALQDDLARRRAGHMYRQLRQIGSPQGPMLTVDGTEYLQFCTNNYLGLANEPAMVDAARQAVERYGTGAGASRLVAGSMALHHQLEESLARFEQAEAALLFPTGFMANLAALTTFAAAADRIVSDKLNHASLLDAAKFSGAQHRTFPHKDYGRAAELLHHGAAPRGQEAQGGGWRFLVTDSVFSMDGDLADLAQCCAVAEDVGALVVIDEAHATGVLGENGRGVAELQGVHGRIAVTVGTLSKALGSIGGFISGPRPVIEMLINAARTFIYTTAMPPACSAASLAALAIVQSDEGRRRRERLQALSRYVRTELAAMGYNLGASLSPDAPVTPIIPVVLGSAEAAVAAMAFLQGRRVWVPAIRPPTVPPGTARLRISLMATHSDNHIQQLLDAMRQLRSTLKPA